MSKEKDDDAQIKAGEGFMLAEYNRLSTLILEEDRQAEQRINFFLTIASAAIGTIIIIVQLSNIDPKIASYAIIAVLVSLILFGINIQNRLNLKTVEHQAYIQVLVEIQNFFADTNPEIATYLSVLRRIYDRPKQKSKLMQFVSYRLRGSLNDLMALANSLLAGGIALVISLNAGFSLEIIVLLTATTIIAAGFLLYIFLKHVRRFL